MRYKKLAWLSIGIVTIIFFTQVYLMWRFFQVNRNFLNKQINLVSQEAYTIDMNARLRSLCLPRKPIIDVKSQNISSQNLDLSYNIDKMSNIDKSNSVTLVNLAMETFLSNKKPLKLSSLDSIATVLLKRENIHTPFYSQIVDEKSKIILATTKTASKTSLFPSQRIQSKKIPLNFSQTKVLQLVFYDPLKGSSVPMACLLFISFFLSICCIYCIYVLQLILAKQKKLTQSKNDFYNQISHELKRPVSILHTAIDSLLNTNAVNIKERRDRYLKTSMNEVFKINGKIDMILTMSMDEEGMFKLNKSRFNVADMIYELKERFGMENAKPLTILVENNISQPMITADRDHIFQCLSNLIENAIKYSYESVEIGIKLTNENGSLSISVSDNGIGIKEENLGSIFKKFKRVDNASHVNGYGIGLSYVKQMVEKHGGNVFVKSVFGKGSIFTICLPVNP